MILQDEYNGAARSDAAAVNAASAWTKSLEKVAEQVRVPGLPMQQLNPNVILGQWFDFAQQVAQVNRDYVLALVGAFGPLAGTVRQQAGTAGEAAREKLERAEHDAANVEREKAERAVEEAAQAQREQAERDRAREARAAERKKAREERRSARERYEGLSKAALVEELGNRGLPKSGKIDDLIERLVDADIT